MLSKRFYGAALMAGIVIPVGLQGCSSDSPLCCSEFKAGATIDAKIEGDAKARVAVQAVADFSGIASAMIDDLTTACRSMATDLEAPAADRDAAEANADKQARMKAWCALAVSAITNVKGQAKATLKIVAKAPSCQASVSAKANCQAQCNGGVKCDLKANPPKCTGGKLEVQCKGGCTAEAGASLSCEGSCSAACEGSCTAQAGGVECKGKCEGTCKGSAQGGTGSGIQADGSCDGTCEGTCEVVKPGVTCNGSCKGTCKGSCKASGSASVKCDGKCDGEFEPIKCEGGKLEGGCSADVKCDANCDASVKAKAECTPPEIAVEFTGAGDVQAMGKLKATLEANLGVVLAFKGRLAAMADVVGTISGSGSAVVSIKAACIPQVAAAAAAAVSDVGASVEATGSIAGAVGTS